MIVNSLPHFSYAWYNELEVFTKEMNAYDYRSKTHWSNIMKLERKVQVVSSGYNEILILCIPLLFLNKR